MADKIHLQTSDDMTLRALALCEHISDARALNALMVGTTPGSLAMDMIALCTLANGLMDHLAEVMKQSALEFRTILRDQIMDTYGEELPAC